MSLRLLFVAVVAIPLVNVSGSAAAEPTDEEVFAALRKAMGREPQVQIDGKDEWVPLNEAKTSASITGLSLR